MGGPRESGQSAVLTMLQFNATQSSRTFFDHETVASALDNICALYEKELKLLNPKVPNITYDIADLYGYLDALHNVSLLMYVAERARCQKSCPPSSCVCVVSVCDTDITNQSMATFRGTKNGSSGSSSHI